MAGSSARPSLGIDLVSDSSLGRGEHPGIWGAPLGPLSPPEANKAPRERNGHREETPCQKNLASVLCIPLPQKQEIVDLIYCAN